MKKRRGREEGRRRGEGTQEKIDTEIIKEGRQRKGNMKITKQGETEIEAQEQNRETEKTESRGREKKIKKKVRSIENNEEKQ